MEEALRKIFDELDAELEQLRQQKQQIEAEFRPSPVAKAPASQACIPTSCVTVARRIA
jgi:hypothetical protein